MEDIIQNGKRDICLISAQRMPTLIQRGKKKKKKSTLEEEIIMYMYKTAIHSFT